MATSLLTSYQHNTSLANRSDSGQAPTDFTQTTTTPAPLQIEFDKYIFKKDELIPANLDLTGAICIEKDVKHTGWLHKLMFAIQKIHQFFCCLFGLTKKDIDPNLCHGSIIMERVTNSSNHFMGNHSLMKNGVKTTSMYYLDEKKITHLIFYVPKNKELRELMLKHAKQTCYEEFGIYGHTNTKRISQFALGDLAGSSFHGLLKKPTQTIQKRTANAVADLLMKNQLLDEKGTKTRSFFCIPYVTTILTASHLIQSLKPGEKELLLQNKNGTKRSREEVANLIYLSIRDRHDTNSLSKAYWHNPMHEIDHRFLATGYVANLFDAVSTPGSHH